MSKLIPLSHLNEYDYKILKLAYEHEHVNLKVLKEHFPKMAIPICQSKKSLLSKYTWSGL